jgi:hypothetical protein
MSNTIHIYQIILILEGQLHLCNNIFIFIANYPLINIPNHVGEVV